MSDETPVIETMKLTKLYDDVRAADEISLSIPAGEIFGLIGPNGAGKSTLIKMLTTLLPPTSGSARVAGHDIVREAEAVRRRIGYVPQLLSSDRALTVYENLLMSARLYALPRRERPQRIADALAALDLAEYAGKLVQNCSGGTIRRVEIAQAMIHAPTALFMDEPTVGLDPVARRHVWSHIRNLRDDHGTTILLTTHFMDEADELCDRIGVLHAGRLVATGTPEALKAGIGAEATLDDVFASLTGADFESGGSYRDVQQTRRSARAHS